jgi:soluble lytic murein transglycosylase-like protein
VAGNYGRGLYSPLDQEFAGFWVDKQESKNTNYVVSAEPEPTREEWEAEFCRQREQTGLDPALVDAFIKVESDYRPDTIGAAGEIGLMQVRPSTARLLGFDGTDRELAEPATNIRLGVMYLAKTWSLAQGDLCRALMKYRAVTAKIE